MKLHIRNRISLARRAGGIANAPGTLEPAPGSAPTVVSVVAYGPEGACEEQYTGPDRLAELARDHPVVWVDVAGLGTLELLQQIGDHFGLHRLALEDVLNVPQRPKLDDYDDHQYLVARMPRSDQHLDTEQLSLFVGTNFLVTIREHPGESFAGVRKRIREGRPRLCESGPDYLLYALLDSLVDSYFPLLEHIGSTLEELEETITTQAEKSHIQRLHSVKHDLVTLRRYLWPLRELNYALMKPDSGFLSESTQVYMRDCLDHSIHALDIVDSYRDLATGLMDLYLSLASQQMNEVMKVLTIIATVFIPLSFIAGLYGMNFDPGVSRWNMPELGWAFGYPLALGLMALCGVGMLIYFWRKGWFR